MTRIVHYGLLTLCAGMLLLAITFFWPPEWLTAIWPFEGTTRMSFIFLSSIIAAAGVSNLWGVVTHNYGALAGTGLNTLAITAPISVHAFLLGAATDSRGLTIYALIFALLALFGLGLHLWAVRIPIDSTIPMPRAVRWSFVVFIIALVAVGIRLVLKMPNSLPWSYAPDLGVEFGWIFIGAAVFFAYSLYRPSWNNSACQLAGFLAYDIVLIGPFLLALSTIAPEHAVALYIYLAAVTYSGGLAIYYLFIHPVTGVRRAAKGDGGRRPRLRAEGRTR